jgi:hypothetical protein
MNKAQLESAVGRWSSEEADDRVASTTVSFTTESQCRYALPGTDLSQGFRPSALANSARPILDRPAMFRRCASL